ncbi:hypothetical protein MTP03_40100 [Tsukamurella sp. PLM1]|nr:hypothetical protein MTP03_40100 [Tsukamurella sp. PLM1]
MFRDDVVSARSIAASSASCPLPAEVSGVASSFTPAYWPSVRTRYITKIANAKIATDATAMRISKKMTMSRY